MRAKTIVFCYATPMGIYHFWPFAPESYTVSPVIFICKTTPGPAQVRNIDFFKGFYHIIPDSPGIWYIGILTYPISAIDTMPQVFRKVTVNMTVYCIFALIGIDNYFSFIILGIPKGNSYFYC